MMGDFDTEGDTEPTNLRFLCVLCDSLCGLCDPMIDGRNRG